MYQPMYPWYMCVCIPTYVRDHTHNVLTVYYEVLIFLPVVLYKTCALATEIMKLVSTKVDVCLLC